MRLKFFTVLFVTIVGYVKSQGLKVMIKDTSSFFILDTCRIINAEIGVSINTRTIYINNKYLPEIVVLYTISDSIRVYKVFRASDDVLLSINTYWYRKDKQVMDGPFYMFAPETKCKTTGQYKMGNLNGIINTLNDSNKLVIKQQCNYKTEECLTTEFYENGKIKKQYTMYGDAQMIGKYEEYYDNGKIKEQGQYVLIKNITDSNRVEILEKYKHSPIINGAVSIKTGIWTQFDEKGDLIKSTEY